MNTIAKITIHAKLETRTNYNLLSFHEYNGNLEEYLYSISGRLEMYCSTSFFVQIWNSNIS
jgi:hypothetical protein